MPTSIHSHANFNTDLTAFKILVICISFWFFDNLGLVCRSRSSSTMTSPVGVMEHTRLTQQLIGVSAEVIALSLEFKTIKIVVIAVRISLKKQAIKKSFIYLD